MACDYLNYTHCQDNCKFSIAKTREFSAHLAILLFYITIHSAPSNTTLFTLATCQSSPTPSFTPNIRGCVCGMPQAPTVVCVYVYM